MLNLYAVTVWHSSAPRDIETIEVRTYSAARAEHLASESFPGCSASAERLDSEASRGHPSGFRMSIPHEIRASHVVRDA